MASRVLERIVPRELTWQPARRVQNFRPTVFAEMTDLAVRHRAVNLGQGFPDFPGPAFVKDAAKRVIDNGANQYAHPHGLPALRQAIAADWSARFGQEIDPERQVTVTSGATEAIFDAVVAMLDPGDEAIAFEPFYDSYPACVRIAGGAMRVVPLERPGWTFSLDRLRETVSQRTRLILVNTPHNPTGKVFTGTELQAIADLAIERDLVVVSDEVYDRILYDDAVHVPIATLPGMWERTLTVNSTGKTFSLTGWKIGYAIGPERLIAAVRSVHQFVTFATATPLQVAMSDAIAIAAGNGYYAELARDYTARRIALTGMLERAGLPVEPIGGTYFLMASFAHLDFATDVEFCRHLITECRVAAIPLSAFYLDPGTAPKLARFCFAKEHATLTEAGLRLGRLGMLGATTAAG